jgi:hypothetical protein
MIAFAVDIRFLKKQRCFFGLGDDYSKLQDTDFINKRWTIKGIMNLYMHILNEDKYSSNNKNNIYLHNDLR